MGTKEANPEEMQLEMPEGMEAETIHEPGDYDFSYGAARPKGGIGGMKGIVRQLTAKISALVHCKQACMARLVNHKILCLWSQSLNY